MRLAGLSVDVDSVASHLEGYGFDRPADDGAAYRLAVPRALDLFERSGARATFFLIAEEAEGHPDRVREICERGHEVASHSMTHTLPFFPLDEERSELELRGSRRLLERLAACEIDGFRAPSWDTDVGLLERLAAAGYRYDASAYPSILLPLLRRSIAARSAHGRARTNRSLWDGVFGPTEPHRLDTGSGQIWEVPLGTTPFARLPHYHTLRFVLPAPAFRFIAAWARTRRGPTTYQFHAVDFLGATEDALDPRIMRHPGMGLPLSRKLVVAEECLGSLMRSRRVVPLRELIDHLAGTTAAARTSNVQGAYR